MVSPPQPAQESEAIISTVTATETVRPAELTAVITATQPPTPAIMATTSTPSFAVQVFYYSYYNPDLLAPSDIVNGMCANQENGVCHTVNCWDYDLVEGRCKSLMASGLDWHEYVGEALACGFEYPLGTVFYVLEPERITGKYTCLDRCPACTDKKQLDFLSLTQKLPWNQELSVQVSY
jgi:hypothetical protein